MANHTAVNGTDNWLGTASNETVTFSAANQVNAADTFNGAGGTDTIITNNNVNYSFSTLASDGVSGFLNIEGLTVNGGSTITFNAAQFGTGKISNSLAVTGNNTQVSLITINNATNFSAANWGFTTWVATSDRVIINGTTGDDAHTGSSTNDSITGGDGNDTLEGLAGDDTITGGVGIDTASYANAGSAVTVSLVAGTATGGADSDTLATIENIIGSGFNDNLTGSTDNNTIAGGNGDDTVRITAADQINSGDSFDGGAGTDTLRVVYSNAGTNNVTFNLTSIASLTNFEAVRFDQGNSDALTIQFNASQFGSGLISLSSLITGDTSAVSTLRIDGASNFSAAGFTFATWTSGTDLVLINGTTGDDAITGSSQADTVTGGAGNDTINGGAGSDSLDGGAGTADWLSYAGTATDVTVSLTAGTATGGAGSDTISGFENLLGGSGNDALTGDGSDNIIEGGAGNDAITGGGGNDTASYATAGSGVTANLATGAVTGGAGVDTLVTIESLLGSGFDDSLTGGSGDNTIDGGAGNDTIVGSAGNDVIVGGAGTGDVLDYSGLGVAVTYDALAGTITKAGGGVDTISGFESINFGNSGGSATGSAGDEGFAGGAGNDSLAGAGGNDTLSGNDGSDTIDGGTGNDSLSGGNFNDFIADGTGADTLNGDGGDDILYGSIDGSIDELHGGTGTDTADYRTAVSALTVTRDAVGAGSIAGGGDTDTFDGIEVLILGQGSDTFTGGTGDDVVRGYRGNDSLSGGDGNDTFQIGNGDGVDTIDGGAGTNDAILALTSVSIDWTKVSNVEAVNGNGNANVILTGTAGADSLDFSGVTLSGIALIDGGADADSIIGSANADTIYGGAGNDTLNGGGGNDNIIVKADGSIDSIDGGAGINDTILALTSASIDWTKVSNVEAANGNGNANVIITGSAGADNMNFSTIALSGITRIDGGAGADSITGSGAADTIYGGAGEDTLNGGAGSDTFLVKADGSSDWINGGTGANDSILAQSAATIDWTRVSNIKSVNADGFANVVLAGTAAGDTLNFTGVTLTGIARIDGGLGDDIITGSTGSNVIVGGSGADTMTGNGGNDTFRFASGNSTVAAPDHITDFNAGDKIDISLIDANSSLAGVQQFHWVGSAAFVASDAGALRAYTDGGTTVIEGNINADTVADFRIVLENNFAIGSGDFILL